MILIYGGLTGVVQVNDTNCHMQFEKTYLEHEQECFNEIQLLDPANISRTHQDVIADVNSTWQCLDHEKSSRGFWHTGVANKLDGSEDSFICREALECWNDLDMCQLRAQVIKEVDSKIDNGELSFSDWQSIIVHPEEVGVLSEGHEFEGELEEDERPWLEDGEKDPALEDCIGFDLDSGFEPEAVVVHEEPGDDPLVLAEATAAARRLERLQQLRALAVALKEPAMTLHADNALCRLKRGRTGKEKRENAILRRHALEKEKKEKEKLQVARAKVRQDKRNRAKVAAMRADQKRKKEKRKDEEKALQAKINALPKTFAAGEVGAKGHPGVKAREECLQKLKLQSPKLTLADEVKWEKTKHEYAKAVPRHEPLCTGLAFIKQVDEVLQGLGSHYAGKSKYNKVVDKHGSFPPRYTFFYEIRLSLLHVLCGHTRVIQYVE